MQQSTATAMEPIPMTTSNSSVHDSNLFPLPESLNSAEPTRHDCPYYSASSDYTDDCTPPTQPFDYLSQAPCTTTEEPRPTTLPVHPPVNQFDSWVPSFYNRGCYHSDYAPSSMSNQIPMTPAQSLPHTTHGLRTPHMDPMGPKTPAYHVASHPPHMISPHHAGAV